MLKLAEWKLAKGDIPSSLRADPKEVLAVGDPSVAMPVDLRSSTLMKKQKGLDTQAHSPTTTAS